MAGKVPETGIAGKLWLCWIQQFMTYKPNCSTDGQWSPLRNVWRVLSKFLEQCGLNGSVFSDYPVFSSGIPEKAMMPYCYLIHCSVINVSRCFKAFKAFKALKHLQSRGLASVVDTKMCLNSLRVVHGLPFSFVFCPYRLWHIFLPQAMLLPSCYIIQSLTLFVNQQGWFLALYKLLFSLSKKSYLWGHNLWGRGMQVDNHRALFLWNSTVWTKSFPWTMSRVHVDGKWCKSPFACTVDKKN